ncbi:hypothetical protein HMN09_00616800 [Mycena chlorophos]|uniref:DUF1764-domain-containing protein n=1 Tax=Mycena chlorophos TaxID=658473 RepID=A0A8H6T2Y9_MYCCL|nr:hypothetical protein HMN09_00616800 [Mycena chlorophos]
MAPAHNEIDDIFESKKRPAPSDSAAPSKKRQKRSAPVDTPSDASHSSKKNKTDPKPTTKPPKKQDDIQKFKDSRGTGPRRKTEEGFAIYKEDELGINDEGGDTPLCPFDCDCCTSQARRLDPRSLPQVFDLVNEPVLWTCCVLDLGSFEASQVEPWLVEVNMQPTRIHPMIFGLRRIHPTWTAIAIS